VDAEMSIFKILDDFIQVNLMEKGNDLYGYTGAIHCCSSIDFFIED